MDRSPMEHHQGPIPAKRANFTRTGTSLDRYVVEIGVEPDPALPQVVEVDIRGVFTPAKQTSVFGIAGCQMDPGSIRPSMQKVSKGSSFLGGTSSISLSLSRQQLTHPAPVFGSNSAEPGGLELEPLALPGPHSASMPTYILACPCQRSTCTPCSTQPSHHTRGADQ